MKPLPNILRRAMQVLREEGVKSLWFKILGETVYRRAVLMERRLDGPDVEVAPRVPVTLCLLQETEVDEYVALRPEADPSEVRRRLAAGQQCFTARHEGRIVHACWVATGCARIDYLRRKIALAPDEVYIYEGFTAPDVRGMNIAPTQIAYIQRVLRAAGIRRLLAVTMPENRPAFQTLAKAGYQPIGVMGYVRLGPWQWNFCRLNASARPPGRSFQSQSPAYWDKVIRRMDDGAHYLDPFLGEMKRQAHLALIARWGGVPAGGRVLKTDLFEEAMGPDAFLTDLADDGAIVIGMDISPEIVGRAKQRDAERRAHYVVADVRHPPFASETIALVVSPSTLDHFPDPADLDRSLCELARLLTPDGRLIITLDNRQNIFDPLLRLVARLGRAPYYLGRSYRVSELRAGLEQAGLQVQETTAILHNPRLVATGAVAVANRLGWPPFTRWVRRMLVAAQRLEQTRWRYLTGSFVAAQAIRRASNNKT